MKIRILIATVLLTLLTITGCDKGFEEMNKDPFNPTTTSLSPVFNSLTSTLLRTWQEQTGFEYELTGVACQLTNIYGSSGYLAENAANDIWNNYYKYLADARLFDRLIADYDKDLKLANVIAQKNTINALKTFKMLDIFGDIPYYDAANATESIEKFYPKYDDQKKVYLDMLTMLKEADASMVESPGDDYFKLSSYDVLFKDDIVKWRKLANSIRLRQAIRAYDKDNSVASHVSDIIGGNLPVVEDNEDVELHPDKLDIDLRARIWAYGGGKVRFGKTMWDAMADGVAEDDIFDPRLRLFSEPNSDGNWNPLPFGTVSVSETGTPNSEKRWQKETNAGTYTYSPINYWMLTGRYSVPEIIITAAEVHFLKAEAYARGIGVSVNMTKAQQEYEAGIKSSIAYWFKVANFSKDFADDYSWRNVPATPTEDEINVMIANPKVAWNSANALSLIYTQRWISHIRNIAQGWSLWRRTKMTPQQGGTEFVYYRSVYPQSEQDNNGENYKAQVSKMGGDSDDVKIWWMK
jgi:hypothetical protein